VVKAQHELEQRQIALQESQYAIEKAKIALGVLIFPSFSADFTVVDDLDQLAPLAPIAEAQAQAAATNPEMKAAAAGIVQAGHEITVARYGYLPSLGVDVFYGINANQFAARTHYPPGSDPPYRQNLGYSAQVTLNIPVWNWGATRSKIKQAEFKRDLAQVELTQAQRSLQGNIAAAHAEARAAQAQLDRLRRAIDSAAEILRLTILRYQAGEAIALEVSDAQSTVTLARNAYNDGLARYRVAETTVRTLSGALLP
jgi:outer membrane protein TolC